VEYVGIDSVPLFLDIRPLDYKIYEIMIEYADFLFKHEKEIFYGND